MAEPGHPYLTDDLDELRSLQRRRLDTIINELSMSSASSAFGTTWSAPPGVSAPDAEASLRDLAGRLLEAHEAHLDRLELNQRAAIVGRILPTGDHASATAAVETSYNAWDLHQDPPQLEENEHRARRRNLRDAAYLLTAADYFSTQA
jgi:hypothetical protein